MENYLELLAVLAWFFSFTIFQPIVYLAVSYLLIFTKYYWLVLLYLIWMYLDRNTPEKGGSPKKWVINLKWFEYMKRYFTVTLKKSPTELDPEKNYIFACFPHGVMPFGIFLSFGPNKNFNETFPHHSSFCGTLRSNFWVPLLRELYLAIGLISVSADSLKYVLNDESGGNIVMIAVGGAAEAVYGQPNNHTIVLKNRKGFVKLAMQTGADLVPVFSFNETSAFDQFIWPGFVDFQLKVKDYLNFFPCILKSRFWICPFRVPVTTIVGEPIKVRRKKIITQDEVDALHSLFVEKITELFEKNKHKYIENPENSFLKIV